MVELELKINNFGSLTLNYEVSERIQIIYFVAFFSLSLAAENHNKINSDQV